MPYNILKSLNKTTDFINMDKSKECQFKKICYGQEYNFKIRFNLKGQEYILVINKYKANSGFNKYVVWIFPYNDDFYSDKKISTYEDLKDPDFIKKIIDILTINNLYDESKHFLAINTYIAYQFQCLHFHILPKSDYYSSLTEPELVLALELRSYSVLNLYNKLKIYENYYDKFKDDVKYGAYFIEQLF